MILVPKLPKKAQFLSELSFPLIDKLLPRKPLKKSVYTLRNEITRFFSTSNGRTIWGTKKRGDIWLSSAMRIWPIFVLCWQKFTMLECAMFDYVPDSY